MHFDDRLATVLNLPASGDGMARVQFRQLVDLLGGEPALPADGPANDEGGSEALDAGFARLAQLGRAIPAADRARLLRQPLQPMRNPRLVAWLAEAEPDVASAAISAARLDDEAWLSLIPRLPVRARGMLRHRRDLSPRVRALLDRLGVHDRALPHRRPEPEFDAEPDAPLPEPAPTRFARPTGNIAADLDMSEDVLDLLDMANDPPPPTSLSEWARRRAAQQHKELQAKAAAEAAVGTGAGQDGSGIGAIVRRIEEFRKAREARAAPDPGADAPRLPLGDTVALPHRLARAIDFTTDTEGRVDWADGPYAPCIVGLSLPAAQGFGGGSADVDAAVRRRLPLRAAAIEVTGAPAVGGRWQVDAVPRFEGGRFVGYCGRLRRPAEPPADAASETGHGAGTDDADRMRQILHELRTPANAIQVAAEIIQQQLYGPAPHEYRALAAAIAGDCAHILAGFEELERLVRLETGAQMLDEGECDLARVLAQTVVRLRAWTEPRGSGFALAADPSATSLPVRVARSEVERLVWRLFAALAGSTAPGETLALSWGQRPSGMVDVRVALPALLAERDPAALFDSLPGEPGQSLATGMFGVGCTLRLATAEAMAGGGSLKRVGDELHLSLPALTGVDTGNSTSAIISH